MKMTADGLTVEGEAAEGTAGGELINLSSDDGGMEETKLGDKEKANSLSDRLTRFCFSYLNSSSLVAM